MSEDHQRRITELETEIRVLREKITDADERVKIRVEESDKRNNSLMTSLTAAKEAVDHRLKWLGWGSVLGIPVALLILVYVIYTTGKTVATEAAREAASNIDWTEQVEGVANEEVKKLVTPKLLAEAIDDETIRSSARSVTETLEFRDSLEKLVRDNADRFLPSNEELDTKVRAAVSEQVDVLRDAIAKEVQKYTQDLDPKSLASAEVLKQLVQQYVSESMLKDEQFIAQVRSAVTSTLDGRIADSTAFQQIIAEQLESERERIRKVMQSQRPIKVENREELMTKLVAAIKSLEPGYEQDSQIRIYPFDDALHLSVRLYWDASRDADNPYQIYGIEFDGVRATTETKRQSLKEYFGMNVPTGVDVMPNDPERGPKYIPGNIYWQRQAAPTYERAAQAIAEHAIELIDDCFGIRYPSTWRVSML